MADVIVCRGDTAPDDGARWETGVLETAAHRHCLGQVGLEVLGRVREGNSRSCGGWGGILVDIDC